MPSISHKFEFFSVGANFFKLVVCISHKFESYSAGAKFSSRFLCISKKFEFYNVGAKFSHPFNLYSSDFSLQHLVVETQCSSNPVVYSSSVPLFDSCTSLLLSDPQMFSVNKVLSEQCFEEMFCREFRLLQLLKHTFFLVSKKY